MKNNNPAIFNVHKPKGLTSTDVVRIFKRHLHGRKTGHMGTLDPLASGVLLVGINGACKVNEYIHQFLPKTYILKGVLGQSTTTGDAAGEIKEISSFSHLKDLSKKQLQPRLANIFKENYYQIPPIYSAVKYQGVPLYRWARKGISIQKKPVLRHILKFNILSVNLPYLTMEITASSGTYMRTLFEDCAKELETSGFLIDLVRTHIGHLQLQDALTRDQWPDRSFDSHRQLAVNQVLPLPEITLDAHTAKRYHQGNPAFLSSVQESRPCWVCDKNKYLLGMGEFKKNALRPVFNWPSPIPLLENRVTMLEK